jgi:hypothetical protein
MKPEGIVNIIARKKVETGQKTTLIKILPFCLVLLAYLSGMWYTNTSFLGKT